MMGLTFEAAASRTDSLDVGGVIMLVKRAAILSLVYSYPLRKEWRLVLGGLWTLRHRTSIREVNVKTTFEVYLWLATRSCVFSI